MRFYTYMMRNHLKEDGPAGDLARDMHDDKETFPMNGIGKFVGWHPLILNYLERRGACDACLEVFENCWEEYVAAEKARRKR